MKVKALFLLFTFLLNSAVGLNCALHKDNDCCDEVTDHHQELTFQKQPPHQSLTTVAGKDLCCQDAVNSFATLAKLVPQSVKVIVPASIAFIRVYTPYISVPLFDVRPDNQLLIDQRRRPPTPDIRIAIQSFQV